MPSHPPIPPLLSPYINPPSTSLTLLTSTLSATTNWLILRFVLAALKHKGLSSSNDGASSRESARETRVVLVSWLRDANFWKDGGRRLGINFQRVCIVDALSNGLGFGPDSVDKTEETIFKAINDTTAAGKGEGEILLVLDGLDFLLAASGCPAVQILEMIGELREHVHSTIVAACADIALTQSSDTPLETSHAAFVMSMAHQATSAMSGRGLDTGYAKDVSGVLRISRGAGTEPVETDIEEKEYLYFVEGDGGVRVFERGT